MRLPILARVQMPSYAAALLPVLGSLAMTACDLVPSQEGVAPPPAHTSIVVAPPARSSAVVAVTGVIAPRPASSPAEPTPLPTAAPASAPQPAASLVTPKLLAKLETGGCGLVSLDEKYLYARGPSSHEVLRIDRASGAPSATRLPSAMLLETVSGGVAYGCPFGGLECKLTAVPLDGGAPRQLGVLRGMIDATRESRGSRFAAVFAPVDASGRPDLASERFTIETVDLASGARAVVFEPVGTGKAALSARGVLFGGALSPKDNVGAASWGLWSIETGSPPRRLPTTSDVGSFASDDRDVYYVSHGRTTWRISLDGKREEQLTGPLESPADEPGRLGVAPGIVAGADAVYVSAASTKACWIWQIRKP